jgi:hypothetical protein
MPYAPTPKGPGGHHPDVFPSVCATCTHCVGYGHPLSCQCLAPRKEALSTDATIAAYFVPRSDRISYLYIQDTDNHELPFQDSQMQFQGI